MGCTRKAVIHRSSKILPWLPKKPPNAEGDVDLGLPFSALRD